MRREAIAFASALLLFGRNAVGAQTDFPCKGNPKVVGSCFTVRGRLGVYNGIPIRIWVVGTHHMLAAVDMNPNQDEVEGLPKSVQSMLAKGGPEEFVVFGDYEVCPLEKAHAGRMQGVCIESASHLVARRWDNSPAN